MTADWVRNIVEDFGGQPVQIGKYYMHPDDGLIKIVSGQYWGRDGLSNHWRWLVLDTNKIQPGYGDTWPEVPAANWMHDRKGPVRGRLVREDDQWMWIVLDGDQQLRYLSAYNRGVVDQDGSVMCLRKTLMHEAP